MDFLHVEFFQVTIPIINKTYLLTGWKLIGYTGVILLPGVGSSRSGPRTMRKTGDPARFLIMSCAGAFCS
ncbi:hypothetical protein [Geitlerinema calcuttense]|uniref:Uncharacterized protein n=1 Tax=Geitlerinema calcuttense NRMC-F 0142 TaxID=2922238 RepID=A0ABT7LY56_9CYAN|nr:hypothetical protein [Geitlerinema calcuttense]MDL5056946.1 hypothetical protein [Geitlerinema calcuttense NRMC-F 0142]